MAQEANESANKRKSPGATLWKEKSDTSKLFSNLYTQALSYSCMLAHTYINK